MCLDHSDQTHTDGLRSLLKSTEHRPVWSSLTCEWSSRRGEWYSALLTSVSVGWPLPRYSQTQYICTVRSRHPNTDDSSGLLEMPARSETGFCRWWRLIFCDSLVLLDSLMVSWTAVYMSFALWRRESSIPMILPWLRTVLRHNSLWIQSGLRFGTAECNKSNIL